MTRLAEYGSYSDTARAQFTTLATAAGTKVRGPVLLASVLAKLLHG